MEILARMLHGGFVPTVFLRFLTDSFHNLDVSFAVAFPAIVDTTLDTHVSDVLTCHNSALRRVLTLLFIPFSCSPGHIRRKLINMSLIDGESCRTYSCPIVTTIVDVAVESLLVEQLLVICEIET